MQMTFRRHDWCTQISEVQDEQIFLEGCDIPFFSRSTSFVRTPSTDVKSTNESRMVSLHERCRCPAGDFDVSESLQRVSSGLMSGGPIVSRQRLTTQVPGSLVWSESKIDTGGVTSTTTVMQLLAFGGAGDRKPLPDGV